MFCSECGTEINNNSKFCYKCGHRLNPESSAASRGIRAMICERCGSNELIRQENVYVCKICNTKYKVEAEAYSDKNDATKNIEKWRKIAKDCYDNLGDVGKAKLYFDKIYENNPDDFEARFFSFHCGRLMSDFDSIRSNEKIDDIKYKMSKDFSSCFEKAMKTMKPVQLIYFLADVKKGTDGFCSLLRDSIINEQKNSFKYEFEYDFMVESHFLFLCHAERVMRVDFVDEIIELYKKLVEKTTWADNEREAILEFLYGHKVRTEAFILVYRNILDSEEWKIRECLDYMDACRIPNFMEYIREGDNDTWQFFKKAIKTREEWKKKGLCQRCGGKLTIIKKRCSECGWPKDY